MSEQARNPVAEAQVLIVEDDRGLCEMFQEVMDDEGVVAVCVRSDEAAYQALRHHGPFACMIVDVNLGVGTTGFDVARFARRIDPTLPVIYMSGQTSEDQFSKHGVAGSLVLPKPFLPRDLLRQIHKLLGDNDDQA